MDRRHHDRIPYDVTIDMTSEHGTQVVRVSDISEGGVFVETPELLPLGTPCQLEVDLAFRVITVTAEVAWHRASGGAGEVGMGMRFTQISPAARSALRSFVTLQCYDDEPGGGRSGRAERGATWA